MLTCVSNLLTAQIWVWVDILQVFRKVSARWRDEGRVCIKEKQPSVWASSKQLLERMQDVCNETDKMEDDRKQISTVFSYSLSEASGQRVCCDASKASRCCCPPLALCVCHTRHAFTHPSTETPSFTLFIISFHVYVCRMSFCWTFLPADVLIEMHSLQWTYLLRAGNIHLLIVQIHDWVYMSQISFQCPWVCSLKVISLILLVWVNKSPHRIV